MVWLSSWQNVIRTLGLLHSLKPNYSYLSKIRLIKKHFITFLNPLSLSWVLSFNILNNHSLSTKNDKRDSLLKKKKLRNRPPGRSDKKFIFWNYFKLFFPPWKKKYSPGFIPDEISMLYIYRAVIKVFTHFFFPFRLDLIFPFSTLLNPKLVNLTKSVYHSNGIAWRYVVQSVIFNNPSPIENRYVTFQAKENFVRMTDSKIKIRKLCFFFFFLFLWL